MRHKVKSGFPNLKSPKIFNKSKSAYGPPVKETSVAGMGTPQPGIGTPGGMLPHQNPFKVAGSPIGRHISLEQAINSRRKGQPTPWHMRLPQVPQFKELGINPLRNKSL